MPFSLGCGWPNNKNYKWADAKSLVDMRFQMLPKILTVMLLV
ncbi:MAG: hypothetical protein ACLRI8_06280 [Agathobacter rectalis]